MPNVVVDQQTSVGDLQNWNTVAAEAWYAGSWTSTAAYDVTQFDVYFGKQGSPTGTVTVELWTSVANDPGTVLTNGVSNGVDATTISNAAWQSFTFATNPTLASSTEYWFVIKSTQAPSGVNYFESGKNSADAGTSGFRRDDNMITPFTNSADHAVGFKSYKLSTVTGYGGIMALG